MNFSVHPFARPDPRWLRRFTHKQAIAVAAMNEAKAHGLKPSRNLHLPLYVNSCAPFWK